jgi:hypothetical protein
MSSLQDYLSKNYGSSKDELLKKKKKKDRPKKTKKKTSHSVTLVDDEPDVTWKPDEDSDDAPGSRVFTQVLIQLN